MNNFRACILLVLLVATAAFHKSFLKRTTNHALKAELKYDAQGYIIKDGSDGWFNGLSTNPGDSLSDPRSVPPEAVAFADKVKKGEKVTFDESIKLIDEHYYYFEVPFKNGDITNAAKESTGCAKIFAFALMTQMNKEQTLGMFGDIYTDLKADGSDYPNIREFLKNGMGGLLFDRGLSISSKLQSGDDTDSVFVSQAKNEGEGEWAFESDSWMP